MIPFHKAPLSTIPTRGVFSHGEMAKEACDWEHTGDWWRFVVYEYDGWIEYKGRRHNHQQGTVVILPPGAHFKQDQYDESLQTFYANFLLEPSDSDVMALPLISELGDQMPVFREQWYRCVRRLNVSSTPAKAVLFHYLWRFAEPLSKYRKNPTVEEAEAIFRERMSEELSLEDVARACDISRNQLIRNFRQEHGSTPMNYLRNMRAEEAHRLLTTTDLPIKAIAQQVGIPSLQYFNRFINDYYGKGPRDVRRQLDS